jgi:hypothetical protein
MERRTNGAARENPADSCESSRANKMDEFSNLYFFSLFARAKAVALSCLSERTKELGPLDRLTRVIR